MTIGASIFLIAVGAILAFAVNVSSSAVDVSTIGTILMIAGTIGLLIGLFLYANNRNSDGAPVGDDRRPPQNR